MSAIVDLTATLTLNPGKMEKFVAQFKKMAAFVHANEPQVLQYEMRLGLPDKNNGLEQVVVREVYADEAAQAAHLGTPQCQEFIRLMEQDNWCSDSKIVFTKPGGPTQGFGARL